MGMMSWLLRLFGDYFRLAIFASGILLGVQIPGFIDQYEKRVDAHLIEAKEALFGFQNTADRYFNGDLHKLISHYRKSQDKVFVDDANNIEFIANRVEILQHYQQSLSADFVGQVKYLIFSGDRDLAKETLDSYSYVVPLQAQSIISGTLIAIAFIFIVDFLGFLGKRGYRRLKTKTHTRNYKAD